MNLTPLQLADADRCAAMFTRSCIAKGNHRTAQNDEPEPRSQHPVIQAGEADAQKVLRHSFTSSPATQEEVEANRREERIAGFDSSPWGVS